MGEAKKATQIKCGVVSCELELMYFLLRYVHTVFVRTKWSDDSICLDVFRAMCLLVTIAD